MKPIIIYFRSKRVKSSWSELTEFDTEFFAFSIFEYKIGNKIFTRRSKEFNKLVQQANTWNTLIQ